MIVLFFAFGGMPQLVIAIQNRAVWFKQRDSNLYTASAYAWSMSLVQLPLSVMEASIFSSIAYFMIGFSTGVAHACTPMCEMLLLHWTAVLLCVLCTGQSADSSFK